MESDHQTYLLTCDAPELLRSFEDIDFRTNIKLACQLDERLRQRLSRVFEGQARIVTMPFSDIRDGVQRILASLDHTDYRLVVTNRLLHPDKGVHCFEINRLVAPSGEGLGLGSRPWHEHPSRQVAQMANLIGYGPIVILEDGSWTGKTVAQLAQDCHTSGVVVLDIICGIMSDKGLRYIVESRCQGQLHYAFFTPASCIDWMPDHDFFPFLPCSGRVLGASCDGECRPTKENDSSVSFPYILPYGDPISWASIPADEAVRFSEECLADTIELFEDMEGLNGEKITLKTISQLYPRASCPQRLESPRPVPGLSTSVLDVLSQDLKHLREEKR